MKCTNCGNEVNPNSQMCSTCGNVLRHEGYSNTEIQFNATVYQNKKEDFDNTTVYQSNQSFSEEGYFDDGLHYYGQNQYSNMDGNQYGYLLENEYPYQNYNAIQNGTGYENSISSQNPTGYSYMPQYDGGMYNQQYTQDGNPKKGKKTGVICFLAGIAVTALVMFLVFREKDENSALPSASSSSAGTDSTADASDIAVCPLPDHMKVGDKISFGTYEQDGDTSNGAEPIVWEVIEDSDGSYLLLSDKILDCMYYGEETNSSMNDSDENVWYDSSLRQWLNADFYQTAFSSNEQKFIATLPYGQAKDKVQIPSQDTLFELYGYFGEFWVSSMNEAIYRNVCSMTEATPYAVSQGVQTMTYEEATFIYHEDLLFYDDLISDYFSDKMGTDLVVGEYYLLNRYHSGNYSSGKDAQVGNPYIITPYGAFRTSSMNTYRGIRPVIRVTINGTN